MSRIPYVDPATLPPKMQAVLESGPQLNIFRMLPHAVTAAPGFMSLGGALLRDGELDPKLRELVILRVGILSGASYEVHQHRQVARNVGVPQGKIDALERGPDAPEFDPLETVILRFTDVVVQDVKAPDEIFLPVAARLSHRALVELILVIGFYMMVSRFLENLEVDIEDENLLGPQGAQ